MHLVALRVVGAAVLALLLTQPSFAQPAGGRADTLRLATLLDELEQSPSLRSARLDAAAQQAAAAATGAWPDLTVGASVQPYGLLTARGVQRSQWRLEQEFPWPGTLSLEREAARREADVSTAEAEVLLADLGLELKQAYYMLLHVQMLERIINEYGARLDAFVEAAAVRYEVGRGPQASILRAQLERSRLDDRLLALTAHRRHALSTLARLLNKPELDAEAVVVEHPHLPKPGASLVQIARHFRPEVDVLEAMRIHAETDVELARKAFYPRIAVGLTYYDIAATDIPATADGRNAVSIGVRVELPIDRSARRARVEAASVRIAQIDARMETLEAELATRADALLFNVQQEERLLSLYDDRLIPQAQTTIESTVAAYTTGQTDFLTLLDAERTLFDLRMARAETHIRLLTTTAHLERSLGVRALSDLTTLPHEHE